MLSPLGTAISLPGPTGERNTYALLPRHSILAIAPDADDRLFQLAHVLGAGARALWPDDAATRDQWQQLPPAVRDRIELIAEPLRADAQVALVQADAEVVRDWSRKLAARSGPVVTLHACAPGERAPGAYPLESLVVERSVSVNTAAAGGNASLMTLS